MIIVAVFLFIFVLIFMSYGNLFQSYFITLRALIDYKRGTNSNSSPELKFPMCLPLPFSLSLPPSLSVSPSSFEAFFLVVFTSYGNFCGCHEDTEAERDRNRMLGLF